MKNSKLSIWIIFGITVPLFLPSIFSKKLFFDGLTYASISNNLAQNIGSAFSPHYTSTLYPKFCDHPPLAFIIQSYFFSIFGSAFYIEKLYSLFCLLLSIFLLYKMYKLVSASEIRKINHIWLLVLLWISMPIVSWSFKNNMLENTMILFTSLATIFFYRYLVNSHSGDLYLGALSVGLGFYTKGLVALFPIALPVIFYFSYGKIEKVLTKQIQILILCTSAIILPMMFIPALADLMKCYYHQQVLASLIHKRDITSESHVLILWLLIQELMLPSLLVLIIHLTTKTKNILWDSQAKFLLFIALSASLPLLISSKQRAFYLLPSTFFYALLFFRMSSTALSKMVIPPSISKIVSYISGIIITITLVYSISAGQWKTTDDYEKIAMAIPRGSIIYADWKHCQDWKLHAHLARRNNISLRCDTMTHYYLLSKDENIPHDNLKLLDEMKLNLVDYKFFQIKAN